MIAAGEITQSRLEILQDSAHIMLELASFKFEKAGLKDISREYVIGYPSAQILKYDEEKAVDLIVFGQRGVGPTNENLGGMSIRLLDKTKISCLIVTS